jgi:hypothetical protein
MKKIDTNEFAKILALDFNEKQVATFEKMNFMFDELDSVARDETILRIIKTLIDSDVKISGKHRINDWEDGWNENLEIFKKSKSIDSLIPKYFDKNEVLRYNGKFIIPRTDFFEYKLLSFIIQVFIEKYIKNIKSIYEFGCGTGINLLRIRQLFKNIKLYGLDWAKSSQRILNEVAYINNDKNLCSFNFDYFNPDYNVTLDKESIVYTVASLEQVGINWNDFIDYLIFNKPSICIHIEPIEELLDSNELIDYLSIKYFRKRNYLTSFLTGLKELEKIGKIEILEEKRTHFGSLFIEGYSIIVWKPIFNKE